MNITDLLQQSGGLESIARELGISQEQAEAGAQALGPAVLNGFQQRATQEVQGGGGGLGGLLSSLGGSGLLDQVLSPHPTDTSAGDNVLGQIFGSREVSRDVAQDASATSGLSPDILKKMLPLLAMVVSGYLAKTHAEGGGGGLGGILGSILGGGDGGGESGGLDGLGGLGKLLGR